MLKGGILLSPEKRKGKIMAGTKLNAKEKVTTMGDGAYIPIFDKDGKSLNILKEDLAEVIRSVMTTATSEKNGLLPANMINSFGLLAILGSAKDNSSLLIVDLNSVHLSLTSGINFLPCSASSTNMPSSSSWGILINFARKGKGDVASGQLIFQIFVSDKKLTYKRIGLGNGAEVVFGEWATF